MHARFTPWGAGAPQVEGEEPESPGTTRLSTAVALARRLRAAYIFFDKEQAMTTEPRQSASVMTSTPAISAPIQERIDAEINQVLASLPHHPGLTADARRGIIARYTAVLEGNFIYWMTATDLAVASDEAHAIIHDNLLEEVRDNHPGMLRKFAIAARAVPTDSDVLAVHTPLQNVRQFVAQL